MKASDAIVVGGGAIGCAIAWALAREGVAVTLFERDGIGSHASSAAAGMLAPLAEAEEGGPLLELGLEGLRETETQAPEIEERSGVSLEFVRSGILRAAASELEEKALRERLPLLQAHGAEWLDPKAAREIEPALGPEIRGALWSPREAQLASPRLALALARAAASLGARIQCATPVLGLVREGDRVTGVRLPDGVRAAAWVILATGAWGGEAGRWLGLAEPVPVEPLRGQILALEPAGPPLRTVVWGGGAYRVPKRDGTVLVGATEERVGFDERATAAGVRGLLRGASTVTPGLRDARFVRAWAGLRPASPDHLALVGPVPGLEGLLLAMGHHRNGILLALPTGRIVADRVLGRGVSPGAQALDPARLLSGA